MPIKSVILEKSSNGDHATCYKSPKIIIDQQPPCTSSSPSTNSDDSGKPSSLIDTNIPADQQDLPLDEVSNDDSVLFTSPPSSPLPSISQSSVLATSTKSILYDQPCHDDDIQTPTSQMINECVMEILSNHTPPIPPCPIPSTHLSFVPPISSLILDNLDESRYIPPAPGSRQRIYRHNSSSHTFARDELSGLTDSLFVTPDPNPNSDHVDVPSNVEDVTPNLVPTSTGQLYPNQQDYDVEEQVNYLVDIPSSFDLHVGNQMPTITNSKDSIPPNYNQMKEKLCSFQKKWIDIFSSNLSWVEFCENCSNFAYESKEFAVNTASTKPHNPAPSNNSHHCPKRPPVGRGFHRLDKAEAQKIQALYYYSKKKAARKILSDNSPTYTGSINSAEAYFQKSFSFKPCDDTILIEALRKHVSSVELDESLFHNPTKEVQSKLRSTSNTSPGPDRVEYQHLKKVYPSGEILSLIFKRCFEEKKVSSLMDIRHHHFDS